MGEHIYQARISWSAPVGGILSGKYSRAHKWEFDGGLSLQASASPWVVGSRWSEETAIDPEEAYVASISSCHMLTFLFLASRDGVDVEAYTDDAQGYMEVGQNGISWVSRVVLRPQLTFISGRPDTGLLNELHDKAHHECFIANSVKTKIEVQS